MDILQHYYTSYVNKETGSAGFQVKAMSPGIPTDTQTLIIRLLSYRIPPKLDEYALNTHPQALRYFYRSRREAILLCSQSNGSDENGRPGNFFAHSLVIEPDGFATMPPILYWRSNLWHDQDPGAASGIRPLNSLEDVDTRLDIDGVWAFLAQGQHAEQFHKLMCAVIHYNTTQRRIVIIDSADNVAQWIAAITFMLPPDYRPLLSFATYHHDPYQAQYMITGTTSDSLFHSSPDEYLSYFILNAETGKISEVTESPYADEAWQAARSYDYYETKLVSLITNYIPRFPQPERIDETLDALALYAGLLEPHHPLTMTTAEIQAACLAIDSLERTRNVSQDDLTELQRLSEILQEVSENDEAADQAYRRVIHLRQTHRLPTDKSALREIEFTTQHIISRENRSNGLKRLEKMRQTYGEEMFLSVINRTAYLRWLDGLVDEASIEQLQSFWKYLGSFILPGPDSQRLLLVSLRKGGENWKNEAERASAQEFFQQITLSIADKKMHWLRLINEQASLINRQAFLYFYLLIVRPLAFEQRAPYRSTVRHIYQTIEQEEMLAELQQNDGQIAFAKLESWINYAKMSQPDLQANLLESGLTFLTRRYEQQLSGLIPQILDSQTLAPLPKHWKDRLLIQSLTHITFSNAAKSHLKLYQTYKTQVTLSAEIYTVMEGLEAMLEGTLTTELARRLQLYFSKFPQEKGEKEARRFISTFLANCQSQQAHLVLIHELFPDWNHENSFWPPYWRTLTLLLSAVETMPQAWKLLTYWFDAAPYNFHLPYTLHHFFLLLPHFLAEARKSKSFPEVAQYTQAEQKRLDWYLLLQEYFPVRKNALEQGFVSLQKLLTNSDDAKRQEGKEQGKHVALQGKLRLLFADHKPGQVHQEQLEKLYERSQHTSFWQAYWECFKELLLSGETANVFAVFSFWFDEAFTLFAKKPFIPQAFFLGLYGVLEEMRKKQAFRGPANQIHARGMKERETAQWFYWIEDFLPEQEKRFRLFRRNQSL